MSLIVRTKPASTVRSMPDIPPIPSPSDVAYSAGGGWYTGTRGLQVAAVVACVGLRAGALAQLPIRGYTDTGGVARPVSPQPELLTNPSPTVVPSVWKTQMSISRDLWGYAAGEIRGVDAAGYASKVEWWSPDTVTGWQDHAAGPLRWRVGGQEVDASLVFHVPSRWVLPGNPLGISPLENSGLVELAKLCQTFGRDWFAKGAIPSAILYSDKEMDSDQADKLLAKITARWRRRQPAVIGSGMKYETVSVKANESQFLETAMRIAADVAISFNMPPSRVAAAVTGSTLEYSNRDQSQQQYLVDSINPDLVVTQEVIDRYLAADVYPRWVTGAFLRSDLKTRYEAGKIGIEAQFIHPDEVRAWEDLPPLTPEQLATMPKRVSTLTIGETK